LLQFKDGGIGGARRRHGREEKYTERLIVNVKRRWEDNIKIGVKEVRNVSI
jgi:hypothetical protein